jgi:hypothetical protein
LGACANFRGLIFHVRFMTSYRAGDQVYIALTTASVVFLASPRSIMVLLA